VTVHITDGPSNRSVWFVTGSQHLYGDQILDAVAGHARTIAAALDLPVRVASTPVLTTPDAIRRLCIDASADDGCAGVIAWMHTFSPAKMWIAGLSALRKPLLHLHTQFNRELPWAEIDMDFMNLNQSAHGDREFAHLLTRLGIPHKTVVGHWRDPVVVTRIASWTRAALGLLEARTLKVARFGDNMRNVAVTEGDKVEAELRFGFSVDGFGVGELVQSVRDVTDAAVDELVALYEDEYELAPELRADGGRRGSLRDAARIESALRTFLDAGAFAAFTDTFEDLGELPQLPGIAAQRLMADGYGFGAEGDWKAAALLRVLKVMAAGLAGGTSFMEDYTYHLAPGGEKVLGAHMLEICPSIAAGRPRCEIHPLSIGGKDDPVRLVFDAAPGPGVVVSLVDLGHRFRLVANEIETVAPDEDLPQLPVARAVWRPKPNLATAAEAWLTAGGSHHTVYTTALGIEEISDFAELTGVELIAIDESTRVRDVRNELRWNEVSYSR
jgi:L-arabinose isomerase